MDSAWVRSLCYAVMRLIVAALFVVVGGHHQAGPSSVSAQHLQSAVRDNHPQIVSPTRSSSAPDFAGWSAALLPAGGEEFVRLLHVLEPAIAGQSASHSSIEQKARAPPQAA